MENEKPTNPIIKTKCLRRIGKTTKKIPVSYSGETEKGGDGRTYFTICEDSITCHHLKGENCSYDAGRGICYLIGIHQLDRDMHYNKLKPSIGKIPDKLASTFNK